MDAATIRHSIAYCGLLCTLCRPDGSCNCRTKNHCPESDSAKGCHQRDCCIQNGYAGCWECPAPLCEVGIHAAGKGKPRAFIRCMREDGPDAFAGYIASRLAEGLVYHRSGLGGDFDLETEEAVLHLLRTGHPTGSIAAPEGASSSR